LKKVLYIDLLSPKGHMKINKKFIEYLCNISKQITIDLALRKDYVEYDLNNSIKNVIYLPEKFYTFENKFGYRHTNYKLLKWVNKNIPFNNYDYVFISSYETISMAIFSRFKKVGSNLFLFNHNNVQELEQSITKKLFFKIINKNISHIVFDEKIRSYLETEIEIKNKVKIIHHPLVYGKEIKIRRPNKINFIFAPSNSNNDNELSKIINSIGEISCDLKIYLKSKYLNLNNENMTISNKWLSEDEYKTLFNEADCIMLLFGDDFNYRISGVFFEAISLDKYILTNNRYLYDAYISKYNNIGSFFQSAQELKEILTEINKGNILSDNSFGEIKKHHSDQYIINQILELFKSSV
jgi:hypothetical protein